MGNYYCGDYFFTALPIGIFIGAVCTLALIVLWAVFFDDEDDLDDEE